MASTFPTSIDSFTNPTAADTLSSVTVPHATQHANLNDAVEAMQVVIGVTASVVTGSHQYRLDNLTTTYSNPLLGTDNESFGLSAGAGLIAGSLRNSFFGKLAGNAGTTLDDSVFIGYGAGKLVSTGGSECVAIGSNALDAVTTTAVKSIAIGFNSLSALTTATDVIAIGHGALLLASTGGGESIAIGNNALDAVTTTAVKTVAIGFNAGSALSTGAENVFIGHSSCPVASTSLRNTACGFETGLAITTGNGANALFGYRAGLSLTTAARCTAIGSQALSQHQSGDYQTAVGQNASSNMRGSLNTSIGALSLIGSATPANNTGTLNVAVGYRAIGIGDNTSASRCTALGANSLVSLTTAVSTIGLGAYAGYAVTSTSNALYIGDVSQHASDYAINTITIASSNADGAQFANAHRFAGVMLLQNRVRLCRTTFSNEAKVCPDTTGVLAQVGVLDASRVVTLPAAATYGTGGLLTVVDESGSCSVTNTLVLTRAGSDTVNGATTNTIVTAYGCRTLVSDGTSKWTLLQSL